jgi:hypothetical protein
VIWLGVSAVTLTLILLSCAGLGAVAAGSALRQGSRATRSMLARKRKVADKLERAERVLHDLADVLDSDRAVDLEYPLVLTELAPKDPWGHPVVYRRIAPDRAELRSAGADGTIGTADDLLLPLPR